MSHDDVYSILNPDVQFLPLVEGCDLMTSIQQEVFKEMEFKVYPNPASAVTPLEWLSNGGSWTASLLDKWGNLVKSWKGGQTAKKVVSQTINLPDIPSGHYYIHLQQGNAKENSR